MWKLLFIVCLVSAAPWNSDNNPSVWDDGLETVFANLPTSGKLASQPWSDTYWPSYQSGIAHRWNAQDPQDFSYKLNSLQDLKQMRSDDIAALSPAEKYDIYIGRYDYPLVHSEWQRTSPDDAGWEGLCHGWAPAAIAFQQPNPVQMTNGDGIVIPFGSSDVKALLTYYCAQYDRQPKTRFIADRCNSDLEQSPSKENLPECLDINAGTYQVIAANMLGNQSGFVIDRDRSIQVWNQPVYSFTTQVNARTQSYVNVTTTTSYAKETYPQWNAHAAYILTETYQYQLDIDSSGAITGGTHVTWDRPDFAWSTDPTPFHGYFSGLQEIYANATNDVRRNTRALALAKPLGTVNAMSSSQGSFGLAGPYPDNHAETWVIAPSQAHEITITFTSIDTERVWDTVRVYEGADGSGALVAVLYGNKVPKPITVKSSGAYVLFKSNRHGSGEGFKAHYSSK